MSSTMLAAPYRLGDGLGVRSMRADAVHGLIEMLEVTEVLADAPVIENDIRARAARYAVIDPAIIAPVRRMSRAGEPLRVAFHVPDGVRLSDLLSAVASGRETLSDARLLDLAAAVIRCVASLHQLPGLIAHGAITPAHVVIRSDGTALLTDAIFGGGIEALHWTREQLWREFGVAMARSASTHRFDQRADVTQLAAVVLAMALRRPIGPHEYPAAVEDLVLTATPGDRAAHAPALRMWLQQALQLHPRSVLATAVDAQHMFSQVLAAAESLAAARG